MNSDSKVIIGVVVATVAILAGGVFFVNKTQPGGSLGTVVSDMAMLLGEDRPVKGKIEAPVTVVEFADFQCPACGSAYPVLKSLLETYPEQVRVYFRHFPLSEVHANALLAAEAAEAARAQGKFWEMHDWLFEEQGSWSDLSNDEALSSFAEYAQILGLDVERFRREVSEEMYAERIQADRADGTRLGVRGTPTLYISGKQYTGLVTLHALKAVIDEELSSAGR